MANVRCLLDVDVSYVIMSWVNYVCVIVMMCECDDCEIEIVTPAFCAMGLMKLKHRTIYWIIEHYALTALFVFGFERYTMEVTVIGCWVSELYIYNQFLADLIKIKL